jgi:hypothetical protein
MMVKVLGLIDAIAAFALLALLFSIKVPYAIQGALVLLLLLKSIPFMFEGLCIASIIDLAVAVMLLLSMLITMPPLLTFVGFLLIAQKAFFSFV